MLPLPSMTYSEPRLKMTAGGRFFIRFATIATYGFFSACAFLFLLSDIYRVRAVGILFAFFLLHRIFLARNADRSLTTLPHEGTVNIAEYVAPSSYRLIERAYERAKLTGDDPLFILFRCLMERGEIKQAFLHLDVPPRDIIMKTDEYLKKETHTPVSGAALQERFAVLATEAFRIARAWHDRFVLPRHLFAALETVGSESTKKLLTLFDVKPGDLHYALLFSARGIMPPLVRPVRMRHRVMNRAWTARPTLLLDRYSEDLTDLARASGAGHLLIGHASEFEELLDILARPGSEHALLVGDPGVGKTAILEHLAHEITRDRVPKALFDKRLVALDLGSMRAGASEAELEARLTRVTQELARAGNVILVVPDLHNLLKPSGGGNASGADILIPFIKRNSCQIIGTTTPQDFKHFLEPAGEFTKGFHVVRIEEIAQNEALDYVMRVTTALEREYKILVSFKAVREAVRLTKHFLRETPLPGSALDLLREAFAETIRKGEKVVRMDEVRTVAEREMKVPLRPVEGAEREKLLHFEEFVHARFVDQDEAVKGVARALREYRSGLARTGGTIANFLFVGPTGVGKTKLAKLVAEIEFGSPKLMLRFDMTEYRSRESISRLIGSTKGEMRGTLTEAVREHPYALLLLDEFEKAHPDVVNLFLQVFDDGRLTDSSGRVVSFENTIIIATSNAHSDFIQAAVEKGETASSIAGYLKTKLTDYFAIELLNRFSDIIVFRNLSLQDLKAVVRIELKELEEALEEKGITITFDDSAIDALAKWGYDPQFGARPLRRAIDEKLKGSLSEKILSGDLKRGDTVSVNVRDEMVVFV